MLPRCFSGPGDKNVRVARITREVEVTLSCQGHEEHSPKVKIILLVQSFPVGCRAAHSSPCGIPWSKIINTSNLITLTGDMEIPSYFRSSCLLESVGPPPPYSAVVESKARSSRTRNSASAQKGKGDDACSSHKRYVSPELGLLLILPKMPPETLHGTRSKHPPQLVGLGLLLLHSPKMPRLGRKAFMGPTTSLQHPPQLVG